jgi:uncharacterized protein YceK
MKKLILVAVAGLMLSGCVNMYTRMPGTKAKITDTYQSTQLAAAATVVAAVPQVMSTGKFEWMWANVFTVPVGCLVGLDCCCEAVIDTVCWPADWWLASYRAKAVKSSDIVIDRANLDGVRVYGFRGEPYVRMELTYRDGSSDTVKVDLEDDEEAK